MRQKTELEITLQAGATGEARSVGMEGTETRPADIQVESQAASGPLMEVIVERDNLRKALAHVKRNEGAAGIDGMSLDAQGIGRHTVARHSDGARPLHPAGSLAGTAGRLGPDALRA